MLEAKFKNSILKTLGLSNFDMNDSTTADQIPGWDSLRHVNVIMDLEQEYGVRLKGREVRQLANIGELQALILVKLKE